MGKAQALEGRVRGGIAVAVALGAAAGSVAVALAAPGDLDPGFGDGGRVTTAFEAGGFDGARAVAIQADGKIVAGGRSSGPTSPQLRFALTRYNPDGTPDGSFGASGRVRTNFGFLPPPNEATQTLDLLEEIAIQPDGKILAVGGSDDGLTEYGIARYRPNGSLDDSFGDGGLVKVDLDGGRAYDVALPGDGTILVAGEHAGGSPERKFGLIRLESDGSLDESFGQGGVALADFPGGEAGASAMAIVPGSGDIVLAGYAQPIASRDFALARFDADGELDESFGNDGLVTTEFELGADGAHDVAILPDGRILVAGSATAGGERRFALARYLPDGPLDPGFGTAGHVVGDFVADPTAVVDRGPDGSMTMLGTAVEDDDSRAFALARFRPDGAPDLGFGDGGVAVVPFGETWSLAFALARQADGRLIAAGETIDSEAGMFALARFEGGAPRLAVRGLPRRRAVGARAKRATFRLRATNVGDSPTGPMRLCVRAPKRRLAVRGARCVVRQGVPAGAVRQRRVVVRVKPAARGKVTRLRLAARGPGIRTADAVVRVRAR